MEMKAREIFCRSLLTFPANDLRISENFVYRKNITPSKWQPFDETKFFIRVKCAGNFLI